MTSERIRKALISAVQKQIAKPVYGYIAWDEIIGECPSCHHTFKRNVAYCPYCGQKLKCSAQLKELREQLHTEIPGLADLKSTLFKELNLEPPCDTIQVENASNEEFNNESMEDR